MPLSPPVPAQPGAAYYLNFEFYDHTTGLLTDPETVQCNVTYGAALGDVSEYAGPFVWDGSLSSDAPNAVWRTGTGQYTFWWEVPGSTLPGVYVANWVSSYDGGSQLATENFAVTGGGPFAPVPSGDIGYWTGSITYQPAWSSTEFFIPLGSTDDNGVTWLLKQVTGWDGPPTVGSVVQRSSDHGGWPTPQYYGPRLITLTVMASAPTQALRDQAASQLVQAVPVNDLAVFQYNEPVPKLAYVRQNASANIADTYPTLFDVQFTIPLVAPDPRKYAVTPGLAQAITPSPVASEVALPFTLPLEFPGGSVDEPLLLTNAGTFETRPVVTVQGPVTNPAVVNATTGQQVSFSGLTLASTDVLVLDMDARQAYLNGSFYSADLSSAWWVLQPGTSEVYLSGASDAGSVLTVAWSSAWI